MHLPDTENNLTDKEIKRKKQAAYTRKWRAANLERARAINRKAVAKFKRNHPERSKEIIKRYDIGNRCPIKRSARIKAQSAYLSGKLIKQPCFCGETKVEAHHFDYNKPLEIQWLCKKHHRAWHRIFIAEGE